MEIEQIGLLEANRNELETQHEELIYTLKEDYNGQLNQQQQLIFVSYLLLLMAPLKSRFFSHKSSL